LKNASKHTGAVKGAACLLVSTFCFTVAAAVVKLLSPTYPAYQITFFRNLFGLLPALWMSARIGRAGFTTNRPFAHFWRTFFGLGNMLLMFTAYRMIPLPDATAISFAGPLFITAFSATLLSEKVGLHRWTAVVVGFCGVLVVMKPGAAMFHHGGLLALSATVCHALAMISLRKLRITENAEVTTLYFTLIGAALTALLLPLGWRSPDMRGFLMLAFIGLISGIGQFFLTTGYGFAEASLISPFTYTSMIWASMFGAILWGDHLTLTTIAGTCIVVASGLYILHRERVRHMATHPSQ
jgi:drug/metabolite transporter (DMT)-like permease